MQETTEQPTLAPEAVNGLTETAARAQDWAGEPFLRPDEDPAIVLAAGTDGTDGPTDAAGAVADAETIARGERAGRAARAALDDNDAYTFLSAAGDLVVSGPTNTNLLDLYVLLRD